MTNDEALKIIEAVASQTEDPPKPAHWRLAKGRPICSRCGYRPWKVYVPTLEEAEEELKFCPGCGAKMEVVKDETGD